MKPKFKVGDKVKVVLELTVDGIGACQGKEYYFFKERMAGHGWLPDCKPFDKIATLVKPKKKAPAKKKVATKRRKK